MRRVMKKYLVVGTMIVMMSSLVACQEESLSSSSTKEGSISSSVQNSLSERDTSISPSNDIVSVSSSEENSTSIESSLASNESASSNTSAISSDSSKPNNYHPIGPLSDINVFSKDIEFAFSTDEINEETASNLINNDILPNSKSKTLTKMTGIASSKKESHVTVNRTTATYSVKDLIEEKHSITQIDSEKQWYYTKRIENTKTVYFKEDELNRHIVSESLYYVDDGCLYLVCAEQSYYEGMEDKGTFESYYYKMSDITEEEYTGLFTIRLESWTFFNESSGLNKIGNNIYNNFTHSSSFYESDHYKEMDRQPTYKYHTSGENGNFGCVAKDDYTYNFSDLNDYPSMEKNELDTINYQQDYLLSISNYFTIEEDYLTSSISKSSKGKVIRDETIQGRKKTAEGCETFYPDLSNFEEREYNPTTK